jgi:hypothetical protein
MASPNVQETLSFGKEEFLVRKVPIAAGFGLLGLIILLLPAPGARHLAAGYALVLAGCGYAVFAFWRRKHPGEPMLILSPAGIRYRIDSRLTLFIPWNEIEGVDTADITFSSRGISWMQRDVPVALVSEGFYHTQVRPDSWWHRGLAWQYCFVPKESVVQVAFFHDLLSQPSSNLRAAIEDRWRAFSRHPNARKPSRPPRASQDRPARRGMTRGQKLAAAIVLGVLALPLIWHWRWGHAWLRFNVGSGDVYLGDLLDREGVPARRSDGRMVRLQRRDVSSIVTSQCHKEITRDPKAETLTPTYTVSAHCVADLRLTSGATAVAIFKLIVTTFDTEYELGKISQGSAIVPALLSLEEAEQQLCALKGCEAGKHSPPAE